MESVNRKTKLSVIAEVSSSLSVYISSTLGGGGAGVRWRGARGGVYHAQNIICLQEMPVFCVFMARQKSIGMP